MLAVAPSKTIQSENHPAIFDTTLTGCYTLTPIPAHLETNTMRKRHSLYHDYANGERPVPHFTWLFIIAGILLVVKWLFPELSFLN